MKLSIVQYVTPTGKVPYLEWLRRLKDRAAKASVIRRVLRIELGDLGDHKRVGDGVSELRIDVGPGYRVYFARIGKTFVVLLTAGNKSTQERDIDRAKKYWRDHQERHAKGQD
jgi:putative addiction module killer protein